MKRILLLVGLLILAMALVACGGGTEQAAQPTAAPDGEQPATTGEEAVPAEESGEPFRVAVVMPSAINDLAFSQSMFDALTAVQSEMGADNFQFDYSDNLFVVDDATAAMRDYASQGYDLVIGHGSQYGSSLQEIAPDFPETSFAWGTTADTFGIPNIYAYEAASDQGGYVLGVLAANVTQSNTIGVVGPIETGDAKLYVDGFVAGAKAAKPDVEVNVIYTGSFSDVAIASETASTLVADGADVMSGTAQMTVGAITVAKDNGVTWFGTQSSQTSLAPEVIAANQVYDWTVVLNDIIPNVKNGVLGGTSYKIDLANGGLVMDYNPDFNLAPEVRAAGEAAAAGIAAGTIDVFSGEPFVPGEAAAEEPAAEAGPVTFGLILVGPRNDRGWSQAHYTGGQYVEANVPGATMIAFESLNSADKPEATVEGVVDDMVAQGASLILTTSDEFEEDTLGVAKKYPDVTFINISGDDAKTGEAPPNLGNMMGRMEDMKAVAGCAAALVTETGKIGYLGPLINFETRRLAASAFEGARYCYENYRGLNPDDLEFTVTWIGFWFNIPGVTLDPTEVVNNFFDTGMDVVMSGIDTTEAIDIAGQRASRGEPVWALPYDYEGACEAAPDICLGVPFFNWGPSYVRTVEAVANGTWTQSWDWLPPTWDSLDDNTVTDVGWIDGPGMPADAQAQLDEFISGLASGSINVWAGPIFLQDGTEYIAEGEVATDDQIWYLPQLVQGMIGPSE